MSWSPVCGTEPPGPKSLTPRPELVGGTNILSLSHLPPPPPPRFSFRPKSVFWMAGCFIGASSGGPQVPRRGRGCTGLHEQGGGGGEGLPHVEPAGQGVHRELPSRNRHQLETSCSRSILGLAPSREGGVPVEGEEHVGLLPLLLVLLHLHGNHQPDNLPPISDPCMSYRFA